MHRHLIAAALIALGTAPLCSAQLALSRESIGVTVEKAGWLFRFPTGTFDLKREEYTSDGKTAHVIFDDTAQGLDLSVTVYPAPSRRSAVELREQAWRAGVIGEPVDVVRSEKGGVARIDYLLPSTSGTRFNGKTMRLDLVDNNSWIVVQLSKKMYDESDRPLFDDFARRLATAPKAPGSVERLASYAFRHGSNAYAEQDYRSAATWYHLSLEADRRDPTLDRSAWRTLVGNLGRSFVRGGNLVKARETFGYGAGLDSAYPIFHYDLATTEAALGHLDESIAQLRLAFSYNAQSKNETPMPDPRTDPAFQRYLDNEAFMQALREIEAKR